MNEVKHKLTKEEIRKIIMEYNTKGLRGLAKELGVPEHTVSSMATRLRRNGFKLKAPSGAYVSFYKSAIEELKRELGVNGQN